MATRRYARDTFTQAQKEARIWQYNVDETTRELAMYTAQVADGRKLSTYDESRQRAATKKLARLMENNPNEPV